MRLKRLHHTLELKIPRKWTWLRKRLTFSNSYPRGLRTSRLLGQLVQAVPRDHETMLTKTWRVGEKRSLGKRSPVSLRYPLQQRSSCDLPSASPSPWRTSQDVLSFQSLEFPRAMKPVVRRWTVPSKGSFKKKHWTGTRNCPVFKTSPWMPQAPWCMPWKSSPRRRSPVVTQSQCLSKRHSYCWAMQVGVGDTKIFCFDSIPSTLMYEIDGIEYRL